MLDWSSNDVTVSVGSGNADTGSVASDIDISDYVECSGDVTEAPPTPGGFHPLDVEITSSSRDTAGNETVTGGNAGDAHTPEGGETTSSRDVEVTSSVVDATGSETVTEGNAGEGNIGVVASTIEPIEPKNDEVLVTEEVLSGRVNGNPQISFVVAINLDISIGATHFTRIGTGQDPSTNLGY